MPMSEREIPTLIENLLESREVEVKNWLDGLSDNDHRARLAKEIIALANSGGGLIFIGFEDEEEHPSIVPDEGFFEAFTQDTISNLVERFISPPCQCTIIYQLRESSGVRHPVILVPGRHRVPLFAARGNDACNLQNGTVYVRRQGGRSEPARTQDDWETLIDNLVQGRMTEQLNAIREIMTPSDNRLLPDEEEDELRNWENESLACWNEVINDLADNDPRRFERGFWTVAYRITPFQADDLNQINLALRDRMPTFSGWRPFTHLNRDDRRPRPIGRVVQAWLGADDDGRLSDFWRFSEDGYAFLLRPYQEDQEGYGSHIMPGPPLPVVDWTLPIYRMVEVFHHMMAMSREFSLDNARFEIRVHYYGTMNRRLWRRGGDLFLETRGPCLSEELENGISGNVSELDFNLNENIWRLLSSIYAQFDFAELRRPLVDRTVEEALNYPN